MVPFAGITPASAAQASLAALLPPELLGALADDVDPETGDLRSLDGGDVVDDQVALALTARSGKGAALGTVGHRFAYLEKVTDGTEATVRALARQALNPLVSASLIKIEAVEVEADPDGDMAALEVRYTNLLTGTTGNTARAGLRETDPAVVER